MCGVTLILFLRLFLIFQVELSGKKLNMTRDIKVTDHMVKFRDNVPGMSQRDSDVDYGSKKRAERWRETADYFDAL